jgi:hypothetical protein
LSSDLSTLKPLAFLCTQICSSIGDCCNSSRSLSVCLKSNLYSSEAVTLLINLYTHV